MNDKTKAFLAKHGLNNNKPATNFQKKTYYTNRNNGKSQNSKYYQSKYKYNPYPKSGSSWVDGTFTYDYKNRDYIYHPPKEVDKK